MSQRCDRCAKRISKGRRRRRCRAGAIKPPLGHKSSACVPLLLPLPALHCTCLRPHIHLPAANTQPGGADLALVAQVPPPGAAMAPGRWALHRAAARAELAKASAVQLWSLVQGACLPVGKPAGRPLPAACKCSHATAQHPRLPCCLPAPPQVRRLLERNPSLASKFDDQLRTPLHHVAAGTSMPASREAIAAMLLAAAPHLAAAVDARVRGRAGHGRAAAPGVVELPSPLLTHAMPLLPSGTSPSPASSSPLCSLAPAPRRRARLRCTAPPMAAPWASFACCWRPPPPPS